MKLGSTQASPGRFKMEVRKELEAHTTLNMEYMSVTNSKGHFTLEPWAVTM